MRTWWWIRRRLAVLRELCSPADWLLFVRILCFAAVASALMRLRLPRLQALLEPRQARSGADLGRVRKIAACVDAAIRVGRPFVRRSCLTRGVTLYYFLRRAGLDVSLCFGIGSVEGAFVGHCWLVQDGQPVLERKDPRLAFAEVYRIPASSQGDAGNGYRGESGPEEGADR